MKKIWVLMMLFGGAAISYAQTFGAFNIEDNTLFAGKSKLLVNICNSSWGQAAQQSKVVFDAGFPKIEKGKLYESSGTLMLDGKVPAKFYQKLEFTGSNDCRAYFRLDAPADFKFASVHFNVALPFDQFRETIFVDGKKVVFPEVDNSFAVSKNAKEVKMIGALGELVVSENEMPIYIQDNRRFNISDASLRVNLTKNAQGSLERTVNIKYKPHVYELANLPKKNSRIEAGNLPRDYVKFGYLPYNIQRDDSCMEIPAGGEAEIPLKNTRTNILYLLNAFEGDKGLSGDVGQITPVGEGVGAPIAITSKDTNTFSDESLKAVWRTKPAGMSVRKLYSTKIQLGGGKIKSVKIKNTSNAPWKIAAATFSSANLSESASYSRYIAEDEEHGPFMFEINVEKGSVLDMSRLLDAPAGKYGFVKPIGNRVAFEKNPDADFKIIGTNICFSANFATHENAARFAEHLARSGYNSVRFHHYDGQLVDAKSAGGVELRKDSIDQLDYLFAELKKRGIYITTDIYVSRGIVKGVLEPEFEAAIGEGSAAHSKASGTVKAMFNLSEKARKNWEQFASNLLNHVNPYTGIAWKDDPALISLSLVNENPIMSTCNNVTRPFYEAKYKVWLKEKKLTETEENSQFLFRKFMGELYKETSSRMKKHLLSLGYKGMITDQNMWDGYGITLDGSNYDIVDTHYYFGHPHFIEKSWSLPARLRNDSSIKTPFNGIDKGAMLQHDKPFYITEWNHVLNNPSSPEGAFLWGAYGALQDWTGYYRFAYKHGEMNFKLGGVGYFDSESVPSAFLSDRVAQLFLIRGDVKKSRLFFPYLVARDIYDRPNENSRRLQSSNPAELVDLCYVGRPGIVYYDKISDVELPSNSKFAIASEQGWLDAMKDKKVYLATPWKYDEQRRNEIFKNLNCDVENGIYRSSTGQIEINRQKETFKVVTPRSEGFVGNEGAKLKGEFARINNTKGYSTSFVGSVDDKPLINSSRLLIMHITAQKNTNMKFRDDTETILEGFGGHPMLARAASTTLTLYRDFTGFKLYAVSLEGKRLFEVPMKIEAEKEKTVIKMNIVSDKGVVMVYELVKE